MLFLVPWLPVPGSVPAGLGVSPQLFSGLHHYQVPHVVDLPVQLAMMFLGVVLRSPVGNPLPCQALGWGPHHHFPTETMLGVACFCMSALAWGLGCVLWGEM